MKLEDNSPMPFGKYKGEEMANVPASYLIWLFENDRCSSDVSAYIKENLDVLKVEVERSKTNNRYNCK